jgi:hypothetical protein
MTADTNEVLTNKVENVGKSLDEFKNGTFPDFKRESREHNTRVDLKLDEQTRMLQEINTAIPTRISVVEERLNLVIEPKLKAQEMRLFTVEEKTLNNSDFLTGFRSNIKLAKWFFGLTGVLNIGTIIAVIYLIREVTK